MLVLFDQHCISIFSTIWLRLNRDSRGVRVYFVLVFHGIKPVKSTNCTRVDLDEDDVYQMTCLYVKALWHVPEVI